MKSQSLLFFLSISFLCFTTSCQQMACGGTKKTFLKSYYSFLDDLEDQDHDKVNWDKISKQYEQYTNDCYEAFEKQMTSEEKREFSVSKLRYVGMRYDKSIDELMLEQSEWMEEIVEELNVVFETTGKDLKDFMDEHKDDIKKAIRDMGKDIEKWIDKLDEILNE